MTEYLEFLKTIDSTGILTTAITFLILLFGFRIIKRLTFSKLSKWTTRSEFKWDNELLEHMDRPSNWLLLILALQISIQFLESSLRNHPILSQSGKIAFIFVGAWMGERLLKVVLYASRLKDLLTGATLTLFLAIGRIFLFTIALLAALDSVGISITPLLASLGVGSLAVALALQDTLNNFFSGIYLLIDKPMQLGDYVRLESGVEGHVTRIGWRSTRITLGSNSMVVVPNSKLSSSVLTNFNLPTQEVPLTVDVSVSYDADLTKIQSIATDIGQEVIAQSTDAVKDVPPVVRFTQFGESGIHVSVTIRAVDITVIGVLKHDLILALHSRFKREGIEIPYPHCTVQMLKETTA